MLEGIKLEPQYRERVWGGQTLRPGTSEPVGEAWIVYDEDRIASGPGAGRTLGEIAAEKGADFLGKRVVQQTGTRFPLLIKLLDCQAWLSLQVHPNNEQAEQLEGPGHFGKTEAWHFLVGEEGAQIIAGVREGVTREALAEAIREGSVIDLVHYQPVSRGSSILTRAGTVHALGPGLLVYEVQQSSDVTYRIFDWNRPQAAGRALHIEQSVEVSDPGGKGEYSEPVPLGDEHTRQLVTCEYFTLTLAGSAGEPVDMDTQGETFHAVTVIEGDVEITGPGWSRRAGKYETVVVPAACGAYRLSSREAFQALVASVE